MSKAKQWPLALLGLYAPWMFAYEAWRESSPWVLVVLVTLPWVLLAAAWRSVLPQGHGTTLRVIGALALVDVALDLASPYPLRFALPVWELARAVAIAAGARAAVALAPRVPRALATLRAASLVVAALIPLSMVHIAVVGSRDQAGPADAALVLGFALAEDGQPRPQLVARMDHAVALHRRGLVPRLLLSGGAARAGKTEASVMRDLAVARGVPAEALVLDEASRSTIENFACALPLLSSAGAHRVLLVTEPWHMARAMLLARRHGLDVRSAPATSPIWESPRHAAYWLFRDANAFVRESLREPFASPGTCMSRDCDGCRKF